jgi:hypothetical protein
MRQKDFCNTIRQHQTFRHGAFDPKPKIGRHKVVRYLVGPPGGQHQMVDVCVLGPSKSFLQEALVWDLDPSTHQGGDDVVFDFSIRVRHAPRRMTSRTLRGGGPVLKRE